MTDNVKCMLSSCQNAVFEKGDLFCTKHGKRKRPVARERKKNVYESADPPVHVAAAPSVNAERKVHFNA